MEDVKDKMKGFMKKVNNSFSSSSSSSSPKFHGRGRVLGSASPSGPPPHRATPPPRPSPPPPPPPLPAAKPSSDAAFDPFDSLVTSSRRSSPAPSATFDCPVCAESFPSEVDVSSHLDSCLVEMRQTGGDVSLCVSTFLDGTPRKDSVEVMLRLLRNVGREPENEKFRRIRMGNPKIREAVTEVTGGVELLEGVGFRIGEEGGEVWATMEVPDERGVSVVNEVVALLEQWRPEEHVKASLPAGKEVDGSVERKEIDRKVRVFFPVPESVAANIDPPDSFYVLSLAELKREANSRKKKIEESQMLMPKSYREKQALVARRKYRATIIRIQFPDGVVLQCEFLPRETTTTLYEFVCSALKDPSLEFELLQQAVPRIRVIPRFARAGEKPPTLEDVDLVPQALLRFKPIETESMVFTGLSNALLESSEPLTTSNPVQDS